MQNKSHIHDRIFWQQIRLHNCWWWVYINFFPSKMTNFTSNNKQQQQQTLIGFIQMMMMMMVLLLLLLPFRTRPTIKVQKKDNLKISNQIHETHFKLNYISLWFLFFLLPSNSLQPDYFVNIISSSFNENHIFKQTKKTQNENQIFDTFLCHKNRFVRLKSKMLKNYVNWFGYVINVVSCFILFYFS